MNTRRLIVLLLAAISAGGAALLMRGMLGGGVEKVKANIIAPKPMEMAEVLVAASDIIPGQKLEPGMARWQQWPKDSVSSEFITGGGDADAAVKDTVARSPIVKGEPLTTTKIVKSDAVGFMAATLAPGMRAVSISVSVATLAGGFILPNNRVDVVLTRSGGSDAAKAGIVLSDVRVLAVDQAIEAKDNKPVSDARTVTLELTPDQTQDLARAQAMGTLSLALRPMVGAENGVIRIVHGLPPGLKSSGGN